METNPSAKTDRVSFKERNTKSNKRSSFTKGGKVPSASEVSSYNREANEIQKRVTEANDRGNVGAQYQVMKEYAKKYGWNLTRKRTS